MVHELLEGVFRFGFFAERGLIGRGLALLGVLEAVVLGSHELVIAFVGLLILVVWLGRRKVHEVYFLELGIAVDLKGSQDLGRLLPAPLPNSYLYLPLFAILF